MLKLERFALAPSQGGYVLSFEGDGGEKIEMFSTYDQLDELAEEIDRQLDAHDEVAGETNG